MGRTATDYSKNVIYVIKCKNDNITEEYIGSTTNFNERKSKHKTCCNNEKDKSYNQLKYKFIRLNGGWDNWIMIELEKFKCNDKREAEKREEEIRVERKAKLNMIKAFGAETKEEYIKKYREENKDKIKEQKKIYKKEHKIEIKEQRKQYNEENKDKIKNYCEKNKDKIKEQHKKYYEEHKEEMKELKKQWNTTEFICNCGWIGINNNKYYHFTKCSERLTP